MIIHFLRGRKVSSLDTVFINLCKGFDYFKIPYTKNLPFELLKKNDRVIVLGIGKKVLEDYNQPNKIIAGIGLMTHPAEWPTLFLDYPIATYLQHSNWTKTIYERWYGKGSCNIWPAGIDTEYWKPTNNGIKEHILIYVKFLWNKEQNQSLLLNPIVRTLKTNQIKYKIITYGNYLPQEYKGLLLNSIGMIFLCEHESQGLAYQEAMAMNVPIMSWNQGYWLDPNRFKWKETQPVTSSSTPYFNENCGDNFSNYIEFERKWPNFLNKANRGGYNPRTFVLENLTLLKSAERMLEIIKNVYNEDTAN
jgi:glycosyltransferase involved in cell wall biosynthesis